ncbi:hypothetical protein [Archangium sp.]|uniref:hypothetical protein n=1 Tax=Archangium sp. TaxID=1872627 RepID=UPI002D723488|nr:hypothetical protein [Archangium sp.]HYO52156.1 hypothetical protein [Archangium sp.]
MVNPEALAHLTRAQELLGKLPAAERHAGEELMVLAGRGRSLTQMRGHGSPEAARTCARALELLRRMDEFPPLLKWSIWLLHSYHSMRAEYPLAHEVAERVVRLGGRQKSLELLRTFVDQGRYRLALESSELALACVRSGPARDWE